MVNNRSPAQEQRRRAAGTEGIAPRMGIWIVHSITDDERIALHGDLCHEHFYYTEGDPLVFKAQYKVETVTTTIDSAKEKPIRFDAVVQYLDGHRECRRVRSIRLDPENAADLRIHARCCMAAKRFGATFVEVASKNLDSNTQRIWNWVRVIGAYHRCSYRPLDLLRLSLLARIASSKEGMTINDALDLFCNESPAMVTATSPRI